MSPSKDSAQRRDVADFKRFFEGQTTASQRKEWLARGHMLLSGPEGPIVTSYDRMSDAQRRAIVEAAVAYKVAVDAKDTFPGESGVRVVDAVRAAECPTWSADGSVVKCGLRRMYYMNDSDSIDGPTTARLLADALNAHERETRGLPR